MSYIYLASPYSDPDPAVREARYVAVRDATGWMLSRGIWVYSPIVHCHDIGVTMKLPTDAKFWESYNYTMVRQAEMLYVLQLPGWQQSKGIAGEIEYARSVRKPVLLLEMPPTLRTEATT